MTLEHLLCEMIWFAIHDAPPQNLSQEDFDRSIDNLYSELMCFRSLREGPWAPYGYC